MQLSSKMTQMINSQIQAEIQSAYLYLAMAADLEDKGYNGCAHWMQKQFSEEMEHAMKFYHYVFERNEKVVLEAIEKPQATWDCPLCAFKDTLAHEQVVSKRIYDLYEQALADKDYATGELLQWFIKEQVEEEASAQAIITRMEMAGDSKGSLLYIDKELGKR